MLRELVLCSPVAAVVTFLSLTRADPTGHRFKTARIACVLATVILLFFALTGNSFFELFDIQKESFQIAGGLLLFYVGFDMLISSDGFDENVEIVHSDSVEGSKPAVGQKLSDVAITPVAIPLLSGPGAISGTVLLATSAPTFSHKLAAYVAIPFSLLLIYIFFSFSIRGSSFISPFAMKVAHRLSGLVLAAMAVQFVLKGLSTLGIISL